MISIRNAKTAKSGLHEMVRYIAKSQRVDEMTIAEIGSYVGDSTEIFAKSFKLVYAIDPWQNGYDDTDAASYQHPMDIVESQFDCLCEKHSSIIKMKLPSLIAVGEFEDHSLDMVYIDGIHQYESVKADIEAWLPKVKRGGWMAGHDYQARFRGTMRAVDEFRKPDKVFPDTSWIIKL